MLLVAAEVSAGLTLQGKASDSAKSGPLTAEAARTLIDAANVVIELLQP